MINIDTERIVSGREACIPLRVTPGTIAKYMATGVRGVRLESLLLGGRRVTSHEAIARFIANLNRAEATGAVVPIELDRTKLDADLDSALKVA